MVFVKQFPRNDCKKKGSVKDLLDHLLALLEDGAGEPAFAGLWRGKRESNPRDYSPYGL
jgi:hypothetical protein